MDFGFNVSQLQYLLTLDTIHVLIGSFAILILVIIVSIAGYIPEYIKRRIEKNLTSVYNDNYNIFILAESEIKKIMKDLINNINCDRILIAEYHNGEMNIANISRLKVSIKLEEVQPGITSISKDIQGVPSSYYSEWSTALLEEKSIRIPDTSILQFGNSPHLYDFIAVNHEVKSIYLLPIKDRNLNLFAVGIVEFIRQPRELTTKESSMICFNFGRISSILDATTKIKNRGKH